MKVPDSLQELGYHVFYKCSKLVPSDIYINYDDEVVVTYLRCKQFGVLKGAGPDGLNQFLDQVIAKVEKLEGGDISTIPYFTSALMPRLCSYLMP
ncbi:hypothetical protein TrVE_jg11023 [Triparma verrucosa]|uniref:Uncharacterized protein n=1 Tax=Triparma verrucosa TaxID=1606542 RepID=A0A9W7FIS0_9STRA|nr:hypothetical protein TrVE_jg11023 [Triparma verrucosa]